MWVSTWLLEKWNFDLQICIQAPASVAAPPGQQLFTTADVCSSHNTLWEETAANCSNSKFKRSPGGFCRKSELILEIHNTTSSPSCICQVFDGKEVGKNARNASSGRAAFPHLLMLPSAPWHWVAFIYIILSCLLLSHLLYLLCIRLRTVTGYMCDGMTLRELWSQLDILHIYRFSRKIKFRLHDLVPGGIKLWASDC